MLEDIEESLIGISVKDSPYYTAEAEAEDGREGKNKVVISRPDIHIILP